MYATENYREVELILSDSRAKGIFIAEQFRGFDVAAMLERLQPTLPGLQHVWTVRGTRGAQPDLQGLLAEGINLNEHKLVVTGRATVCRRWLANKR